MEKLEKLTKELIEMCDAVSQWLNTEFHRQSNTVDRIVTNNLIQKLNDLGVECQNVQAYIEQKEERENARNIDNTRTGLGSPS